MVLVMRHVQLYGPCLERTFASAGVFESRLRQQVTSVHPQRLTSFVLIIGRWVQTHTSWVDLEYFWEILDEDKYKNDCFRECWSGFDLAQPVSGLKLVLHGFSEEM